MATRAVRDGNDRERNDAAIPIERAIAANYERLSPGQRRVIDRLLDAPRYAAVTSAPELAKTAGAANRP